MSPEGARNFNMGTPAAEGPTMNRGQVDWRSHKVRDIYEEKFATQKENKYDEKDEQAWMNSTRAYLIGRNPVMDNMLTWAEAHGENHIDNADIARLRDNLGLMTDLEPSVASSGLWAFLNLIFTGDAIEQFQNVEKLNGFEAWRRITAPIRTEPGEEDQSSKSRMEPDERQEYPGVRPRPREVGD